MDSLTEGLNRDCIGRDYRGDGVIADADLMRAFALAACDPNPRYIGEDIVAHPLFPVRLLRGLMPEVLSDPELRCDYSTLVHGEQQFRYLRAIRPGDQVDLRGRIMGIEDKRSGQVLRVRQQLLIGGEPAVEGQSVAFIRGSGPLPAKTATGRDNGQGWAAANEPDLSAILARQVTHITSQHAQQYAQASGDHNPIHLDRDVARAAGFDDVILHGTCTLAFAVQAVVDGLLECDPQRLKSVSVRFSGPVVIGDCVTTEIRDAGPGRIAFESRNSAGRVLLSNGLVEC